LPPAPAGSLLVAWLELARRPPLMNTPRRRPPARQPSPIGKWLPAIAAVSVLAVVVLAGAVGGGDDDNQLAGADAGALDGTAAATSTSTSALPATDNGEGYDVTGLTVPPSTVPDIGAATTLAPSAKTPLSRTLLQGTFGDDVKQVQTRLTELGFVPGVIDGAFGEQTREAVWAYEKLILQTRVRKPPAR